MLWFFVVDHYHVQWIVRKTFFGCDVLAKEELHGISPIGNREHKHLRKMSKKEPCRLVIKPAQRMNISGDIMTRYVQECIGNKFRFFLDKVECEDGKQCQFTFIFESRNQGKKAATIVKENAVKKTGKELQVTVLKEVEGDSSPAARTAAFLDAALPIYAKKSLIIETIKDNQVCIVLGETGSGKSTQMTQYLYEAGFAEKGAIVCTQPRKVAATSLADHVAHEMGDVRGQIVGCRVGGNIQASKITRIVYATDHVLLRECLKDPNLSKYSCIIIDEAHERSIYSDLLLGMIKKTLTRRPDLRVVISSATIDPSLFVSYFNECPVLKVSGRMFPVHVTWKDDSSHNFEDYLRAAVDTVREIHRNEGQGDILVFLTSPVETERACENLSKLEPDTNLVCLPLHGKLRQEEQRKVFELLPDKRKVVFATNCAETSITIPGIKYVVDSGMVKEMKYDANRNKSSLEVTTISKSSAEQRKGRAGRTQEGKCYRLYSEDEYEALEDRSGPEILRVHLGQAVLKLLDLGIEDISQFDFVEAPPQESIELALKSLTSLGAIERGALTALGKKIARVPVEPRLAKLIFDGIDQNVGAEAVALAAVATKSESLFCRMGGDKERELADSRKIRFCHNGGDLLTMLEVFRQYLKQPKAKRNKWAFDNSLNEKSLRLTEETVKELKLALKHELDVIVLDASIHENGNIDQTMQRILIDCYVSNLAVYTGHEKTGYRIVSSNQSVQIHPSSALNFLGATPQFVVFEQLLKTSRDFAINTTAVEESWLCEMISAGTVSYTMADLKSTVMSRASLPCSPDLMKLAFGGSRRRVLGDLEEEVSKLCGDSIVVLEKDERVGQINVFALPIHVSKALYEVEKCLEQSRRVLRCEDKEESLKEGCEGTRIVWGLAGEVQDILMPHMYRTVTVNDVYDSRMVINRLKSFGEVVKHHLNEGDGECRVFVTFKRSEDAYLAVKSSSEASRDFSFDVRPNHSISNGVHSQVSGLRVKVKWCRRLPTGTGSIMFCTPLDQRHSLGHLSSPRKIGKSLVRFQPDKKYPEQIFMRGLHPKTSEENVKATIEGMIPSVKIQRIFIHREREFETTDEEVALQKKALEESLLDFATEGKFNVYVRKPNSKDFEEQVYLTFEDFEECQAALKALNGRAIPGFGTLTLPCKLSTVLLCPRNVFIVIKDELDAIVKKVEQTLRTTFVSTKDQQQSKGVAVEIRSECADHFIRVTTIVSAILNGDEIDCKISKDVEVLLTDSAKKAIQTIQNETNTVISQDWGNKVVRIHGQQEKREEAKSAINKFIGDLNASNSHFWQIGLRGPGMPSGLLKALIERFGVDLHGLQEISGVQNVTVEFRRHVLKIISSDEAQETIKGFVNECCENLARNCPFQGDNQTQSQAQLACGICLRDLGDTDEIYRLACCGHAYDKRCIIQQLRSSVVPLKCVTENCEEPVVWKDFQNLLGQSERKKLLLSSLDAYVRCNPDSVKYCPTPDCGMVYRVSTDGRSHTCGACFADICTSCHTQSHRGLACAKVKSRRNVKTK
ncbi:ATP-dependent RNA helicase DEAH12 [Acropora cervicornis]|uniref:RNA helicase n=1 Tax=Acropora cervicornis TaxID=6130 RepID=A0AAD9Q4E4_ACRCE|nr:ATP-dependent RNA helicase DEAH12 [Acropora cervicornis]